MKKITITLTLAFVFAFSLVGNAFADGNIGLGGRACGGVDQPPCEPPPPPISAEQTTIDTTTVKILLDYLSQIF